MVRYWRPELASTRSVLVSANGKTRANADRLVTIPRPKKRPINIMLELRKGPDGHSEVSQSQEQAMVSSVILQRGCIFTNITRE